MEAKNAMHIHFLNTGRKELCITEFGHSCVTEKRTVGPWIRDVWILHVVVRGTCHLQEFDAGPGEAFWLAKGRLHTLEVPAGYEHYWIAFDGEEVFSMSRLFSFRTDCHQHFTLKLTVEGLEMMLADAFQKAYEPEGESVVIGLLFSLLSLKMENAEDANGSDVQKACSFMRHNYYRKISMEEVARHVNLSEKHLCRLFKKELSVTPMQYLIRLRMEQARMLLRDTDMMVKDVALTVGYPSQLAFSSAFASYWGMAPSSVKRQKTGDASTPPVES